MHTGSMADWGVQYKNRSKLDIAVEQLLSTGGNISGKMWPRLFTITACVGRLTETDIQIVICVFASACVIITTVKPIYRLQPCYCAFTK